MSETEFIGKCLRKSRKFARKNDIHLFIIAHPTKLLKNKDGEYPIPELWDVSGSAHWRNKADNGICVHRDYEKNETVIYVQKIKFKYCGKQGECILKYDLKSGRYYEDGQQASWWD
jgi:twinkle protein